MLVIITNASKVAGGQLNSGYLVDFVKPFFTKQLASRSKFLNKLGCCLPNK